ncbi:MAG: hypothetical protein L3J39_03920, partial [Verrucomicrobiales bacterium]|nr:hypothetical protein [Verrucomicrobiales bacterium]
MFSNKLNSKELVSDIYKNIIEIIENSQPIFVSIDVEGFKLQFSSDRILNFSFGENVNENHKTDYEIGCFIKFKHFTTYEDAKRRWKNAIYPSTFVNDYTLTLLSNQIRLNEMMPNCSDTVHNAKFRKFKRMVNPILIRIVNNEPYLNGIVF